MPEYDARRLGGREGTPDDVRDLRAWLRDNGAGADIDVVGEGETPAGDPAAAAAKVAAWAEAGCTWWMETRWGSDAAASTSASRSLTSASQPALRAADTWAMRCPRAEVLVAIGSASGALDVPGFVDGAAQHGPLQGLDQDPDERQHQQEQ